VCLSKDPGTCNGEITNTIPSKINMQELITKYALNTSFSDKCVCQILYPLRVVKILTYVFISGLWRIEMLYAHCTTH